MIRYRRQETCLDWKPRPWGAGELKNFAKGLREDESAVAAASRESRSNGPVEGQVSRLKFIKRSTYGRAGWHLLRARAKRKD